MLSSKQAHLVGPLRRGVDLYTFGWALGPPNPDFGPPNDALGPPNLDAAKTLLKQVGMYFSIEDSWTVVENKTSVLLSTVYLEAVGENFHGSGRFPSGHIHSTLILNVSICLFSSFTKFTF